MWRRPPRPSRKAEGERPPGTDAKRKRVPHPNVTLLATLESALSLPKGWGF